jgi:hypothetical protein
MCDSSHFLPQGEIETESERKFHKHAFSDKSIRDLHFMNVVYMWPEKYVILQDLTSYISVYVNTNEG